jgi:2-succinyl-5-enolpyruvyl-6-hydroxy-3-cyclohexene-1-carboxylate synthase
VTEPNPNAAWAAALVDALIEAGLRHVCLSPGSRSAPLALAVAAREARAELTTSIHFDERSAAFFGLGYGRATGSPAALVCTSGTAAANYYPAIVEAFMGQVPLLALTADRPPELRDTGAWQAIDQLKLYGPYLRWFAELGLPDDRPEGLRYARNVASRAVAIARGRPAGPVHLNLPFREPLTAPSDGAVASAEDRAGIVRHAPPVLTCGEDVARDVAEHIAAAPRGLILCGRLDAPPAYAEAVAALAAASGYPILAEPAGGLRFGAHDRSAVVTGYDAFLRDAAWCDASAPELVLRFGASFTWKQVAEFLDRQAGARQIVVDPGGTWDDPTRQAAWRIGAEELSVATEVTRALAGLALTDPAARAAWRGRWLGASSTAARQRQAAVDAAGDDTVAWVYPALLEALPADAIVFAANSMAIRDLDTFTGDAERPIRVLANRGAAGIDGTVSSALGAAFGSRAPTALVTGDLAFLHDVNGLAAAGLAGLDAVILVLNDDGGGIFDYLPVARHAPEQLWRYFLTPTGTDLAAACRLYHVDHARVTNRDGLRSALGAALASGGVRVIELPIAREANTALHRRYWSAVAAAL